MPKGVLKIRSLLVALTATLGVSKQGNALQLYTHPNAVNEMFHPEYKKLTFYLSDSAWNFQKGQLTPTNGLHVAIFQRALDVLASQSGVEGLKFQYGGTFNSKALRAGGYGEDAYHKRLYFDLTTTDWSGASGTSSDGSTWGEHAGYASPRSSSKSGGYYSGGYEHMNGKQHDIVHPRHNFTGTIIHETLHILGLDHSANAAARMSYMNPVWEGLGGDDVLGLAQIFGGRFNTKIKLHTKLEGADAAEVEVILIDATTGKTFNIITAQKVGTATLKHVPPGSYYLAAREITPTGPCYSNPAKGFLTTFYVSDTQTTNRPSEATLVNLEEGKETSATINLIKGKKKFDCYYSSAMWASWWSNTPSQVIALYQSAVPSAKYLVSLETNNSHWFPTGKEPDIEENSDSYKRIELAPIGSSPPLKITDVEYRASETSPEQFLNYATLEVANTASEGSYAAVCYADGEYALSTTFVEVRNNVRAEQTNAELFPEMQSFMSDSNAPKTIFEGKPSQNKGEGKKPTVIGGVACGTIAFGNLTTTARINFLLLILPLLGLFVRRRG